MKLHTNIDEIKGLKYPVISTGGFDGVHSGHAEILRRLVEVAGQNNGESLVITFSPHPRLILDPGSEIQALTTDEEKTELFRNAGIDHLLIMPFTLEFSRISSEEFIKNFLVEKLNVKKLIIGYDHHFGNNRMGDYFKLEEFGRIYNFEIENIGEQLINDIVISSTKIRNYLNNGDIKAANTMLGYNYHFTGNVIKGNKIGTRLGFPTANIDINYKYKLIPPYGVYAVKVKLDDEIFNGMLYIGNRPTFPSAKFSIEVNILDFDKDIYNKTLTVSFVERIRADKKFSNTEDLIKQIEEDKIVIQNILKNTN